jgi:hypothetical protein
MNDQACTQGVRGWRAAARRIGCSPTYVRKLAARGTLACQRADDGTHVFRSDDLDVIGAKFQRARRQQAIATLAEVERRVAALEALVAASPLAQLADFACDTCGAHGLVRLRVHCTACETQTDFGYWPDEASD